jgi:hypothetical protein
LSPSSSQGDLRASSRPKEVKRPSFHVVVWPHRKRPPAAVNHHMPMLRFRRSFLPFAGTAISDGWQFHISWTKRWFRTHAGNLVLATTIHDGINEHIPEQACCVGIK